MADLKTRYVSIAILGIATLTSGAMAQIRRPFSTEGTLKEVGRGSLVMNDRVGRTWQLRFAGSDGVVTLSNNRKFPARAPVIEVTGTLGKDDLKKGMPVQFECYISDNGRVGTPVTQIRWLDDANPKPSIKQDKKKKNDSGDVLSQVTGTVERVDARGFMVRVRSRITKKGTLAVPLDENVELIVKTRDLSRARQGDAITEVQGVELASGDYIIQKLAVRMLKQKPAGTDKKESGKESTESVRNLADAKYESLSDDPVPPRLIRDAYLPMQTDLSDRRARMLLDELQEELQLLAQCLGRKPTAPIQIQAIADEKAWSPDKLSDARRELIKQGKSEIYVPTDSSSGGRRQRKVAICAPAKTLTLRSDLAHAYFRQLYGGIGPDWYSEGMAEVAKYWRPPANEVQVDTAKLRAFSRAKEPKSIKDIIQMAADTQQEDTSNLSAADKRRQLSLKTRTARERQAYRWALCFLMANNPNYKQRFQQLSAKLLAGQEVTIEEAFGKAAPQLQFELDQFVANVDNGYRMDLSAWQWAHRFRTLKKTDKHKELIQAKLGWQPLVLVEEGVSYDVVSQGNWTIDGTGTQTTGDGDDKGIGKVVAAVLQEDYQLSKPIPVGRSTTFVAPASGKLYLRCDEKWSGLADNSGKLTVHIRPSKKR